MYTISCILAIIVAIIAINIKGRVNKSKRDSNKRCAKLQQTQFKKEFIPFHTMFPTMNQIHSLCKTRFMIELIRLQLAPVTQTKH